MDNGDKSEINGKEKTLNCVIGRSDLRGSGRGGQGAGRERFGDSFCSYCETPGHIRDYCYSLHPELHPIRTTKVAVTNPATASSRTLTKEEYLQFKSVLSGVLPPSSQTPTTTMAKDKGFGDEKADWYES